MANTSTKNFPHAYGAGRCVAAFSLSHPGGPFEPESQDATRSGCLSPPAFNMDPTGPGSVEALDIPGASSVTTPDNPTPGPDEYTTRVSYSPDVQPLNATCFGVFATGSGLKSLPYRRALAPYCPASVSQQIFDVLPGVNPGDNEIRPLGVVEQVKCGSTRAQYVVQPVEPADPATDKMDEGCCYYEVALDWTSPDLTISIDGSINSIPNNWATTAIASVRESLTRTLWMTASYGDSAGSEANPLVPETLFGTTPPTVANTFSLTPAFTTNPTPSTGWEPMYGGPLSFAGDPVFALFTSFIEPYEAPSDPADPDVAMAPEFAPHVSLVLKVKSAQQVITATNASGTPSANSTVSTVMELAPLIRVIVPTVRDGSALTVPGALPRTGLRPSSSDAGLQPPCVNVQVWQKNSSATDGTTTPVYDLFYNWDSLGADGL